MTTPFDIAIRTLEGLGFFKFLLPFILSAAIFYGLLRKSQLFGPPERNVAVNATVALAASFFIWSWPVLMGIDITAQMSAFFMQGFSVTIVAMVGLLLAGMFLPPDLPTIISEKLKAGWVVGVVVVGGMILMVLLLISSGLYQVFAPKGFVFRLAGETLATIGAVVLLLAAIAIIVWSAK